MSARAMSWEEAVLWLRGQPNQAELVRACFYDDPLTQAADRYYRSSEWRAVQAVLYGLRGRALDLGAGRGIASCALARDGWATTAVEPDPSGVVGAGAIRQLALASGVPIEVVEDQGESLPFSDHCFELVHCRAVLHHARDLTQLCREVARVLVPGGMFLATREHVISRREDLPRFLSGHPLHQLYGGEHAYLLKEYCSAVRGAGFQLTQVLNPYQSDINLFPDTMVAFKRRLAARVGLPFPDLIPNALLSWLGSRTGQPGRHYSFVAIKPVNG